MGTCGHKRPWTLAAVVALALAALSLLGLGNGTTVRAQELSPGKNGPSVNLVSAPLPSIPRGEPGHVDLRFHIASGFHINSNKPSEEFMIPTALHMDAITDIVIGKIYYPDGQDVAFEFAPDQKLSVYSGTFTVGVTVRPLHTVPPGKYAMRGALKYQACDNRACYPPKQLPVEFEVRVVKAPTAHGRRPAQSPHAHS
jgi:Disulphide bond corrector protein DsbC